MTLRRRSKRTVLSLLLSLSLLVSLGVGLSPAPQENAAAAEEETGFQDLNAKDITDAMKAGWNLGNQMEASKDGIPSETAFDMPVIQKKLFQTIYKAGFRSVRIPVSWLNYIGKAPDYTLEPTYLARLQEVVDYAISCRLYVIIDAMHGDGYSTVTGGWILPEAEDQDAIKEKYAKVWEQIAATFKDYDQHVIFESLNEVGADAAEKEFGSTDAAKEEQRQYIAGVTEKINAYNQVFVDTVRQTGGNNDKRWVLIPGCNTNLEYTLGYSYDDRENEAKNFGQIDYGFKLPEDTHLSKDVPEGEHRIMVSIHYYSPWVFCGDEHYTVSQWGDEANMKKSVGYQGEDYMSDVFGKLQEKFTSQGYPVVIGEYGSIDKTVMCDPVTQKTQYDRVKNEKVDPDNNEYRKYFAYRLCSESKANGIIPVYWDNAWNGAFGYGLVDRENMQITQQGIIDGIMSVYGAAKKGTATDITLDQTKLNLDLADNKAQLTAAIAPETSTDTVNWSSSNTKVATVSYKGTVRPKGIGTCVVTATTDSGKSAYCIVEVKYPKDLKLGLYAQNSNTWSMMEGDQIATVKAGSTGGEYTISMVQDKDLLSYLATLYIKDVTVQKGLAKKSIVESLGLEVTEATINGKRIQTKPELAASGWAEDPTKKETDANGVDIAFLNCWWTQADLFDSSLSDAEVYCSKVKDKDQYLFYNADKTSALKDGDNTLTLKFKITNTVFKPQEEEKTVPVTSLELSNDSLTLGTGWKYQLYAIPQPADTTETVVWFSDNPKVAAVDKDGVISALTKGSANIHAMTISGVDVVCPVTVQTDDGTLTTPSPEKTPEPTKTPEPGTQNTSAPGTQNTSAPGGQNTSAPGTQNTSAPGGQNTSAPGGQNTPAPGTQNTPAPGGQQTAAPGGSNGSGNGGGNVTKPTPKPQKVTVKKVSLKKVKSSKKKTITVQWKKLSGVSGYKIQVCTSKKFKKSVKKYTVKSAKTTKKTIKKLKRKKKYYVRVCAYKKANGKTYTGKWSSAKKVKVK